MPINNMHVKWNPWREWAQAHGENLPVAVWSVCGRCGGKISRLNHNEMAQGYHNRCMTSESGYAWGPGVRLYAHDGQLEIKLVGKD